MCAHIFWACECVRLACAAAAPLVPTYLPRLVVPTYVVKITETLVGTQNSLERDCANRSRSFFGVQRMRDFGLKSSSGHSYRLL